MSFGIPEPPEQRGDGRPRRTVPARVQRWLLPVLGFVVIYTGWIFLNRHLADLRWTREHAPAAPAIPNAEFEKAYAGKELKILQFYARDGVLTEGEKTVICYGVVNAVAVKITPPLGDLSPAINRCVNAAPMKDTRFTLTAEGKDGGTVSAGFDLKVVPDAATLPKITYFRIAERKRDYLGKALFVLAYADVNGEEISIDPPVFAPLHKAPMGRFYVKPEKTTTYTLKVTGKNGHFVEKQLTVEVPGTQP